jgi:hypothetical protein
MYEIHNRLNRDFDWSTVQPTSSPVLAAWNRLIAENPARGIPAPPPSLTGGLTFAGAGGQPRRVYEPDLSNIQPRAGFAWKFMNKTVLRGGVGIFHRTATQNNLASGFSIGTPYINSLTAGQFPSSGLTGTYSLENPWPGGLVRPEGAAKGIQTNLGLGVSYDPPNRLIPRTYQWSFTLERELPFDMVLEASYVGSRTVKEWVGAAMNNMGQQHYDAAQTSPDFYQARVPNPFFGIFPASVSRGASPDVSRELLLRPRPHFDGITNNLAPWGHSYYYGPRCVLKNA